MDTLQNIFTSVANFINEVLGSILFFLPDSPLNLMSYDPLEPYLQFINYILPIQEIIVFLEAWLLAITVYYVYQLVLRWLKAID